MKKLEEAGGEVAGWDELVEGPGRTFQSTLTTFFCEIRLSSLKTITEQFKTAIQKKWDVNTFLTKNIITAA